MLDFLNCERQYHHDISNKTLLIPNYHSLVIILENEQRIKKMDIRMIFPDKSYIKRLRIHFGYVPGIVEIENSKSDFFEKIEELSIEGLKNFEWIYPYIRKMKNLKKLQVEFPISSNDLPDNVGELHITNINHLVSHSYENIYHLDIFDIDTEKIDPNIISNFPNLIIADFNIHVGKIQLKHENLESIRINCYGNDFKLDFPDLKYVEIFDNSIEYIVQQFNRSLQYLIDNSSLETLRLVLTKRLCYQIKTTIPKIIICCPNVPIQIFINDTEYLLDKESEFTFSNGKYILQEKERINFSFNLTPNI